MLITFQIDEYIYIYECSKRMNKVYFKVRFYIKLNLMKTDC